MALSDNSNLDGTEARPAFPLHKEGFTIADYHLIVRIGEGSFGEVWKAERGGFPVALKILNASINTDEAQRELKSLETLKKIHHKFLVHTENFWSDGDRLYIEMELAEGGTLKERLKAYQGIGKEGIPEDELLKYFTEAAQALDYLHGHRPVFLHRDIKPANILLVQGCAKLADFGLLRQVTGDNTSTKTQGGTPVYMAPESVKEDKFSVASDLWSFAVTYAELRQGRLPFSAKTQFQIFQKVCQDPPELGDIFHPEERKVLLRALEKEPGQRFSSCGDFVFELNRVVPWTPALTVAVLPTQERAERKPGSTKSKGMEPSPTAPADQGTFRKKLAPALDETTAPEAHAPNAPTLQRDDGTVVNEKARRSDRPARTEPLPDAATTSPSLPPTPTIQPRPASAAEKKSAAAFTTPGRGVRKRNAQRILIAALVVAVLSGIGLFVSYGLQDTNKSEREKDKGAGRDKSGPPSALTAEALAAEVDHALRGDKFTLARQTVEQNQSSLPDAGEKLFARIDHKEKAFALLKSADELLKKRDFEGTLALLTKAKTPFDFRTDVDRKSSIIESAQDGLHGQLVSAVKDAVQSRDPARIRVKLDELNKFRDDYPRADWQPIFQELPLPAERLAAAWTALLADKVATADARRLLQEIKDYASPAQPERFVLDPLFEKNLVALEALVHAHEANASTWDAAAKELARATRLDNPSPVSANLWSGLGTLENDKKLFRFTDLDALPPAPAEPAAHQACVHFFARVLERLVRADNYKWIPDDAEMRKCRTWLADFKGPNPGVLALKAECLVRSGAKITEIREVAFPAQRDWYVSYVHALVVNENKKHAEAADMIVKVVKENDKVRKERMKDAGNVLRTAAGTLLLKGRKREWGSHDDASKAVVWLQVLLELDGAATLDDLLDLTAAAVKSQSKEGEEVLKTLPNRFDKLAAADRRTGYRTAAQAFGAEFASASAGKEPTDPSIQNSVRAQDFAYRMKKAELVQEAADLNAKAVAFNAQATFGKTKDADAKYRVFAEALKKAQDAATTKPADGFALPVLIAALESSKDFSKSDLEATISAAEAALRLPLPKQDWSESLRGTATVRTADAKYLLLFKKRDIGEAFTPAEEYPKILGLYQKARLPEAKYIEKFDGELLLKIGRLHVLLLEYKKAYVELKNAREKLAAIRQPYAAEVRAEIIEALALTNALLNSEELKKFDAEK